jgi:hypothetical protein
VALPRRRWLAALRDLFRIFALRIHILSPLSGAIARKVLAPQHRAGEGVAQACVAVTEEIAEQVPHDADSRYEPRQHDLCWVERGVQGRQRSLTVWSGETHHDRHGANDQRDHDEIEGRISQENRPDPLRHGAVSKGAVTASGCIRTTATPK